MNDGIEAAGDEQQVGREPRLAAHGADRPDGRAGDRQPAERPRNFAAGQHLDTATPRRRHRGQLRSRIDRRLDRETGVLQREQRVVSLIVVGE